MWVRVDGSGSSTRTSLRQALFVAVEEEDDEVPLEDEPLLDEPEELPGLVDAVPDVDEDDPESDDDEDDELLESDVVDDDSDAEPDVLEDEPDRLSLR